MQVGERKLLAPQMHSITITLRVHCWSLISTHGGKQGQRGLAASKEMWVIQREKEDFQKNVLRWMRGSNLSKREKNRRKQMQKILKIGNLDPSV